MGIDPAWEKEGLAGVERLVIGRARLRWGLGGAYVAELEMGDAVIGDRQVDKLVLIAAVSPIR